LHLVHASERRKGKTGRHGLERFALLAVLIAALLACAGSTVRASDLAKDRAVREFGCPRKKLRVRYLSQAGGSYRVIQVAGCGVVTTYACSEEREACVKESDDRARGD
jgi:hypothetical protein